MILAIIKSIIFHTLIVLFIFYGVVFSLFEKKIFPKKYQSVNVTGLIKETELKKKTIKPSEKTPIKPNKDIKKEKEVKEEKVEIKKAKEVKEVKEEKVEIKKAKEVKVKKTVKKNNDSNKKTSDKTRKEIARKKELQLKKRLDKKKKLLAEKKRKEDLAVKELMRKRWLEKLKRKKLQEENKRKEQEQKILAQNNQNNTSNIEVKEQSNQEELNRVIMKYSELIRIKMAKNWIRPINSENFNLETTIGIKLHTDGKIRLVRVIKSSGSGDFDTSVLNALWRANILPIPKQKKYLKLFTQGELEMEFKNF